MTPYHSDSWLTVYGGDCREVVASMEPESVHCVVTSPPYWGLRDYGTATWIGGDEACGHVERKARNDSDFNARTQEQYGKHSPVMAVPDEVQFRGVCGKCGATRQDRQLGLEPTPEEYVANLVDVFREVRRVLRADGTVWLNLGDSYAQGGQDRPGSSDAAAFSPHDQIRRRPGISKPRVVTLKPKDLVGIPWRVAFALQADGWYLRSDIIWAKPNPMPESVTDRPTKSHEYLFLLSKSPRYYFDAEAVREEPAGEFLSSGVKNPRHGRPAGTMPYEAAGGRNGNPSGAVRGLSATAFKNGIPEGGRNIRSVWTVATQPYPGAHFAVFPEKLVEPCILAGCPVDGVALDPFGGSGTVGRVANRLSRRAVLIDLNPDYLTQQMARNRDIPLGLGA